mmetsp:Transcript_128635/g.333509  ORF Transcript_128635/g.333509 Transcript_128635/m.333509 type:complete len:84 (-) Transcript_128635:1200-1451(-)
MRRAALAGEASDIGNMKRPSMLTNVLRFDIQTYTIASQLQRRSGVCLLHQRLRKGIGVIVHSSICSKWIGPASRLEQDDAIAL